MANQFDSLFADKAWDGFTRTQGAADLLPTLTTADASHVDVAVVGTWEPWGEDDEFDDTGKRLAQRGIFSLDPAVVAPAWVPDVTDTFTIGGVVYAVERIAQTLPVAVLHLVDWEQRRILGRNTFRDR